MFKDLIFLFVCIFFLPINSAAADKSTPGDEYLAFAQVMPIPVGGYPEIYKNISYPEAAQKAGIQGKVFVMAYVDESGKVVDCTVLRGLGAGCDEEAIKAVLSTKFSPGMNDNTKVKVKVALTIVFKLT